MAPAYASFGRRLRALVLDSVVLATALVVILLVGDAMRHVPGSGRVLVVMMYSLILYEPIMVWRFGATIGHRVTNLRVVDDVSGGNPGFLKSLARFVIKAVLGSPSFLTMAWTRRRQAVHDAVTHTTVQIRDMNLARDGDYYAASEEPADADMPSAVRRLIAIALYIVVSFFAGAYVFGFVAVLLGFTNTKAIAGAFTLLWFGAAILILLGGWYGRLPGARRRRSP